MYTIKGTVKNGVIHPLESVKLSEGQSVMIVVPEENQEDKSVQSKLKPLFERDKDTGREIVL
jgi:predicted DNA-binding antitoxin AbrB/MazE fold protein